MTAIFLVFSSNSTANVLQRITNGSRLEHRLDRGMWGRGEIFFGGAVANEDIVVGRGCLDSEQIFLRLERSGDEVRALCSQDGEHWLTAGQIHFPAEDPLQTGLHAIGHIDRTIYPGAYRDGTAIRFEAFQLWKMWVQNKRH
jgi:hypothetical protein